VPPDPPIVVVAARNEHDRIVATLRALGETFPGATVWVADDASDDSTAEIAMAGGARVVSRGRPHGKGANVTAAAEAALGDDVSGARPVLLCDADLGASAGRLAPLVEAVMRDECDLAVASFARRVGGGLGVAVGFARWAVERRCGLRMSAPLSGQRAMRADVLRDLIPLAPGFGLETGMDIDAVRAGYRVRELELELEHRATGRTPGGFLHRGRQLRDIVRVYGSRRMPS
jgi:glycosyltransferase involved in cell wall biosynthesis